MKMKWLLGFDISIFWYFQTLKLNKNESGTSKAHSVVTVKNPCALSLGVKCVSLC